MEGDISALLYFSLVYSLDLLFLSCFVPLYYNNRGEKRKLMSQLVSNIEACVHQSLGVLKTSMLNISTLPCGAVRINYKHFLQDHD
jgi:hypothetical protein